MREVMVGSVPFGESFPLVLIAGPCVLEPGALPFETAAFLKELTDRLSMPFIFKASYDKANRSSHEAYRGPGIEKGLKILAEIKEKYKVPILTDVHTVEEVMRAKEIVDVIQIPAFLCRQTDLILSAASSGKVVNIKKGQFLAPLDIRNILNKCLSAGNNQIIITERGTTFGYNNLVSDMRALPIIRSLGVPVVFDATHSVQLPGGAGTSSAGERQFVEYLSRAAVAAGCDGVFFECHPNPSKALCDGQNALRLDMLEPLLRQLMAIDTVVKKIT
ncbi:3-deoxy-8-phosphooctulonate synthase [bacterium]|nr:3-deoxy-8-phosphooctulonate synthase [bacterium]MCP5462598.1 3-deoxy-8-phosphooctulonate synthase [bacterium]